MILQGINDQLKSYMISLKIARPFGVINLGAILLNIILGYVFIMVLEMPIYGFPICKFINEVIVFVLCIVLWKKRVEPKSKSPIIWKWYREEVCGYICTALKVIVGFYCTFLGFELNTYFAGITKDDIQIAAFVGWTNLAGIVFCTGLGFGIIGRTKIGHLVGAKKFEDAKNLMYFNLTVTGVIGCLICVIFLSIRYYMTFIYTNIPEISQKMSGLFLVYAFCCIIEFSNAGIASLMRLTGNIKILSFLMFLYIVVIQGTLSYVFCFVCGLGVEGILYSFACSSVLLNGTNLFILSRVDWENVTEEDDDEKEDSIECQDS